MDSAFRQVIESSIDGVVAAVAIIVDDHHFLAGQATERALRIGEVKRDICTDRNRAGHRQLVIFRTADDFRIERGVVFKTHVAGEHGVAPEDHRTPECLVEGRRDGFSIEVDRLAGKLQVARYIQSRVDV